MNNSMHSQPNKRHVVVIISSHGYGHAAMTAPLINRLQALYPELKITLRTAIPLTFLKSKFNGPFGYLLQSCDFGMLMNSAFEVDQHATLQAYRQLHSNWQMQIEDEMRTLEEIGAGMVISNIAYLPLIAARQLGIPAIAISCLNWADIFSHFFTAEETIHQQMIAAYRSADCFIRTEPAMPMSDFTTRTVAPLVTAGPSQRQQLIRALKLDVETRLILVTMGGIKTAISAQHWPAQENIHYIAANSIQTAGRNDITHIEELDISYSDALCSCDLLLTKPGYGSFTEAACNNIPVLYVHRDEWPEQPFLTAWLQRQIPCHEITLEQFRNGDFMQPMQQLLQQKAAITTTKTGVEEAATIIADHLQQ